MPFDKWAYDTSWWNNWTSAASQQTITIVPSYWGSSTNPPSPVPKVEMPEGPLDWLRRRVTEITDLAYAA